MLDVTGGGSLAANAAQAGAAKRGRRAASQPGKATRTMSSDAAKLDAAGKALRAKRKARSTSAAPKKNPVVEVMSASAESAPSPASVVQEPVMFAASLAMAPYAAMGRVGDRMRRARGLSLSWMHALSRCKSPQDLMETNMRFTERAMAFSFNESCRVIEDSSMMGRKALAPASLALRGG